MSLFLLFLFSFLESIVGIWYFFPGTVILIIYGALVWYWYFPFWLVFLIAFLWNILWSLTNYFIWYKIWKKWFKEGFLFLKPWFFKKGYNFVKKHKWKFLILGKLIPWIKENITFVAGMLHLDLNRFLIFNTIWAFLWSLIYIWLGYTFYNSLNLAFARLGRTEKIILFLFLVLFGLFLLREFLYFFWKKIFILVKQIFYYFLNKLPPNIKKFVLKFSVKTIVSILIIFSLIYLILNFIGFTSSLYHLWFVSQIDRAVSNFMFYYYDPILEKFFLLISYFWSIVVIICLALIFLVYSKSDLWKTRLILGLFFLFVIIFLTKFIVHRSRPELSLIQELSYSFPSFHAWISMFFYWFLATYFAKFSKKWWDKVNWITIWLFVILMIWLSRLYLNVHYFSDVVWGYWLWLIILWIVLLLKQSLKFPEFSNKLKRIIVVIVIIFLTFYLKIYFGKFSYSYNNFQTLHNINSLTGEFNKYPNLKYTTTIFWRKTEPINFIFLVKSRQDLVKLFSLAGFYPAEKLDLERLKKLVTAAYDGKSYKEAPMLPIFWDFKTQIFWFQKQEWTLKKRHHIRIWNTWWTYSGYIVYVWCAVFDDGIKWRITHKISPDIDKEREYFFDKLLKTGLIYKYKKISLVKPIKNWKNFSYDKFFTDWKAYILWVK